MTQNQIAYWQLQEQKAQNARVHAETVRSNKVRETETNRANVARETETARSNAATEAETARSNLARETETRRSNIATETETHRANLARETLQLGTLNETIRANKARETETARHNIAVETETARSNRAAEANASTANAIRAQANAIQLQAVRNTNAHNVAMENLQDKQITTNYWYQQGQLAQNEARLDLNVAQHSEVVRHNQATEQNQLLGTGSGLVGQLINAASRALAPTLRNTR